MQKKVTKTAVTGKAAVDQATIKITPTIRELAEWHKETPQNFIRKFWDEMLPQEYANMKDRKQRDKENQLWAACKPEKWIDPKIHAVLKEAKLHSTSWLWLVQCALGEFAIQYKKTGHFPLHTKDEYKALGI